MESINCTFFSAGTCSNANAVTKTGARPGSHPSRGVCTKQCASRNPMEPAQGPLIQITIPARIGRPIAKANRTGRLARTAQGLKNAIVDGLKRIPGGNRVTDMIERRGRELWRELHLWALAADAAGILTADEATAWLKKFGDKVPCGTCKAEYFRLLAAETICSAGGLFALTVRIHNAINAKLNKPIVTENEARSHWVAEAAKKTANAPKSYDWWKNEVENRLLRALDDPNGEEMKLVRF